MTRSSTSLHCSTGQSATRKREKNHRQTLSEGGRKRLADKTGGVWQGRGLGTLAESVHVVELANGLIADLPNHGAGRAAKSVLHGDLLRAVVMVLDAGREMSDNEARRHTLIMVYGGGVWFVAWKGT